MEAMHPVIEVGPRIIPTQGELLGLARRRKKISVKTMAAKVECDTSTIGNYEHDRTPVRRSVLVIYAQETGYGLNAFKPDPDDGGGSEQVIPSSSCIAILAAA